MDNEFIIHCDAFVNSDREEGICTGSERVLSVSVCCFPQGCLGLRRALRFRWGSQTYQSGPDTVSAYLARPPGKGPFPALIVIHEWWGLNEWVKHNAERFAAAGYVALAIDLYRGQVAQDPGLAHELMRGVPPDRAVRDLQAAMEYLRQRQDVKEGKIGAIGWCMGGGYALKAALELPPLTACIINYGHLITEAT